MRERNIERKKRKRERERERERERKKQYEGNKYSRKK